MQNAWRKYGERAFAFSVLEFVEDATLLIAREQFYIDTLKPEYNCAPIAGSCLGAKRTDETKRKVSQVHLRLWSSPEYRKKMSDAHKGQILSEEHRAKIGAAHKGRKLSPEHAAIVGKNNAERNRSSDHRAKMSAYWKGRSKTPEQIAKISAAKRNIPLSEDHKAKLAKTMRLAHAEGRHDYERTDDIKHAIGRSLAKLTDDQVREIRAKRRDGVTCKILSAEYGISQPAISCMCNGNTYSWVSD